MTVEEILVPRYRIIADWPGNIDFEVGSVITLIPNNDHRNYLTNPFHHRIFTDEGSYTMSQDSINEYPHLFKPVGWWEERQESDLPDYVKWADNKGTRPAPYVRKVKSHFNKLNPDFRTHSVRQFLSEDDHTYTYSPFLPATEEEYLNNKK